MALGSFGRRRPYGTEVCQKGRVLGRVRLNKNEDSLQLSLKQKGLIGIEVNPETLLFCNGDVTVQCSFGGGNFGDGMFLVDTTRIP